jgi:ABC-type transporter Mla MlaB component
MNDATVQVKSVSGELNSMAVKIVGPMNVSNVSTVLLRLLAALEQADSVTIDLSEVTEIDAAGLQLFCSSHRSSIFSNKEFRIIGQEKPEIWKVAAAMGCLRKSGCALDTKQTCIWTGGAC